MINDILQSRAWHKRQQRQKTIEQLMAINEIGTLGDCIRIAWGKSLNTPQGYMTEPMSTDPIREGVIPSTVNAVYTELHNAYMRAYNETQQ